MKRKGNNSDKKKNKYPRKIISLDLSQKDWEKIFELEFPPTSSAFAIINHFFTTSNRERELHALLEDLEIRYEQFLYGKDKINKKMRKAIPPLPYRLRISRKEGGRRFFKICRVG